ncbi:Outer membrane protein SusF domain-containing protein [Segatella copri]|uniref:Outer membrane protein SusF domain-containing protein n=2 Tax=Segatella copri TaxID=165179 RepID=UPI003F952B00
MNTMKKTLLYSLAAMASLALASCAGDYDDWANPQANEQEASAAKYGVTFANGSEAEGSMADEDGIINLVTVNSTDANVSGFTLQDFKVNGVAVNGTMVGNSVQVSASELEKLVCEQNKSRASVARDLKVETQVSINLASGDAVSITTKGETTGKFTPTATPQLDEKGYYMLGQVNGNEWDAKSPVWMNKISDGVYQLKVTTTADKNWFKFYAGSNFVSEDWDSINKGALGCKENGSEEAFGYILYNGDSWGELQTPVIPGAGTWIVTLDMNNLTYTVGKPVLYMAGDANGWATNDYLAGDDGVHFTGYMYLNQNGFKFCTQPEWKGTNYGANFDTAPDAGNITMTEEAGYYKVDVDLSAKTYTLIPITTIGIIGSASPNGWDSDVDMTYVPYNAETKELGYWEAKDITLASGEIKFRANDDWAINWGGDTNALTQGGDNISVEAGTYDIKLYAWANGYAKCELIKK